MVITGGNSVKRIYEEISLILSSPAFYNLNVYLSDERYGPSAVGRRNDEMVQNILFRRSDLAKTISFFPMPSSDFTLKDAAYIYDKKLPSNIDLGLLTIGDDGHVASLFSEGMSILNINDRIVACESAPDCSSRVSIGMEVINGMGQIFLLAPGMLKWERAQSLIRGGEPLTPIHYIKRATIFAYENYD